MVCDWFGWRSEGWEASLPTWMEQQARPLGIIRRMIADEAHSPASALQRVAGSRQRLADDLENRLASDPGKRARFRDILTQASSHVSIKEDRAHWQLIAFGSLWAALLRRGEKLARQGGRSARPKISYTSCPTR